MSTSKLGIVTNRSTGDQVGEMEPMDRDQAQTIKKAAQRSGISVDVKDPQGNNLAEEVTPEDGLNVAKEVAKCLRDALREHGDEIKSMALGSAKSTGTIVKVQYMPDEQGNADEDRFVFHWDGDKLILGSYNNPVEICNLQKQSGTVTFQKDLAKNALLNFLKSHDSVDSPQIDSQPVDPNALPDGPVAEQMPDNHTDAGVPVDSAEGTGNGNSDLDTPDLWESKECQEAFCNAVTNFRNNAKDKEAIKALIKAARPFQKGNTIQEKFKGAVDWYNIFKENPPQNNQKQVFLEEDSTDLYEHILKPLSEILNKFKDFINTAEDTWLGSFYRDLRESADRLFRHCGWDHDKLQELVDLDDPVAHGDRQPDPIEPNYDFDDEEAIKEGDEFGPEVGDEVEYDGGHYKLYGYCGYEVVLQNVDDERDFKVVKPADAGLKRPEKEMNEGTQWVDPDNMQ